jgi:hypothetical protein
MFPLMLALANPVNYGKLRPGKLPQEQRSAISIQQSAPNEIGTSDRRVIGDRNSQSRFLIEWGFESCELSVDS